MRIYEKISNYIKKNKLSSESIARRSGISQKDFQAIMNGKQTLYPEELRAICYALNVKPEKFM
ncbi:MAG: helix-turn-helix transcriptional regulator [Ruminococcus sp.]|nr:helix-turn-helix transcriptional regulator [Ruminococcus sp.]